MRGDAERNRGALGTPRRGRRAPEKGDVILTGTFGPPILLEGKTASTSRHRPSAV
ncbi:MAG: hypothetical protein ACR2RE_23825 [Geminicoccaceae bacterium]